MSALLAAFAALVVLNCATASDYAVFPMKRLRLMNNDHRSLGRMLSGGNVTLCKDICDMMPSCKLFNHNRVRNKCWFKSVNTEDLPGHVRDDSVNDMYQKSGGQLARSGQGLTTGSPECSLGAKYRPMDNCSSTYYVCEHAEAEHAAHDDHKEWQPMQCPGDLVFHNTHQVCDFAHNACLAAACVLGAKYRPQGDCSSTYYVCEHAEAEHAAHDDHKEWQPMLCPHNLVFSNDHQVCDHRYNSECN